MDIRSSRWLRKGRVVVLNKFDCWIKQARSFVTGKGRLKNKRSRQDDNATRCDVTIPAATIKDVSRSRLPQPTHGIGVLVSLHTVPTHPVYACNE